MNENCENLGYESHSLSKDVDAKSDLIKICGCSCTHCTHANIAPICRLVPRYGQLIMPCREQFEASKACCPFFARPFLYRPIGKKCLFVVEVVIPSHEQVLMDDKWQNQD